MHIGIFHYIIFIDIIAGLVLYRILTPPIIKWLIPFLIVTLFVEVAGLIMGELRIRNHWLYNYFTFFEFVFYSILFRRVIENKRIKKIILYAVAIYPVLFIVNIFFVQGVKNFHTITYRIGSVMVVVWCYFYLRQLMRSNVYFPLFRTPFFWISTGLLFFYTGFFFWMSADILIYIKIPLNIVVWGVLSDSLNVLLYTCFLISFLCQIKITKKY